MHDAARVGASTKLGVNTIVNKIDLQGTDSNVNEAEGKKVLKGPPSRTTPGVMCIGQEVRDLMMDQMRALLSTISYKERYGIVGYDPEMVSFANHKRTPKQRTQTNDAI